LTAWILEKKLQKLIKPVLLGWFKIVKP